MPPARHDVRRAPESDHSARAVGRRLRQRRADHQERQGAGSLFRRNPDHDRPRDVHGQRDRARHRQPTAPLAGRVLRPRQGQDARQRQAPVFGAGDSVPRLVDRLRVRPQGHSVRPHRPAPQVPRHDPVARVGHVHRGPAQLLLRDRYHRATHGHGQRADQGVPARAPARYARQPRRPPPEDGRSAGEGGAQVHPRGVAQGAGSRRRTDPHHRARHHRPRRRPRRRRPRHQRSARRVQRRDLAGAVRAARGARHRAVRDPVHRRLADRAGTARHAAARQGRHARPGEDRNLPPAAPGRPAHARCGRYVLPQPVLQRRTVQPVARRAAQAQPQARHRRAVGTGDAAERGHPGRGALSARTQERRRHGGRHRPPGQPPRAGRRRTGREPVPHRAGAHGARGQGAHEPAGRRDAHAAGIGQLQAGVSGPQGILRLQPTVAVHGPDQPAVRGDAQAAAVRARARRPDPRAGRVRGARRAPDALRAGVPDRNPGGAEHRVDLQPFDVCARERVRLHRNPVPRGQRRPRQRHGPLPVGPGGREPDDRPGQRAGGRRG